MVARQHSHLTYAESSFQSRDKTPSPQAFPDLAVSAAANAAFPLIYFGIQVLGDAHATPVLFFLSRASTYPSQPRSDFLDKYLLGLGIE